MKSYRLLFVQLCWLILLTACAKEESPNVLISASSAYVDKVKTIDKISKAFVIAHGGYWDSVNPFNSLSSMKRALKLDIYGTEMDIHQTRDGKIVVNHDSEFYGMSIANSTYEELCNHTLSNGETIPLFESFLQAKKEICGSVKLIVELKNCNVIDLVALIENYGLQGEVEYISFSANSCNQLVNLGYGHNTYYLGGDISPINIKAYGYGGMDYSDNSYSSHSDWIYEAQKLGLETIVWTVNDMDRINNYVLQGVIVTTDKPLDASIVCNNLKGYEKDNKK